MRSTAADRATPIRRLTRMTPAAPAAAANQATELTGPMRAAACSVSPSVSDSRIGKRLSKVTIEKPQNSSTATSAARTRDPRSSPMPSPMTPGTARMDVATAARPRAARTSCIRTTIATRLTTLSAERDEQGQRERRDGVERVERDERARDQRADAIARLSTVVPALRPCSISASGSAASVASTYHASSGPLSSARKTPWRTVAAANSATESAT